jgi:hypothetical protein
MIISKLSIWILELILSPSWSLMRAEVRFIPDEKVYHRSIDARFLPFNSVQAVLNFSVFVLMTGINLVGASLMKVKATTVSNCRSSVHIFVKSQRALRHEMIVSDC